MIIPKCYGQIDHFPNQYRCLDHTGEFPMAFRTSAVFTNAQIRYLDQSLQLKILFTKSIERY